MTVMSTLLAPIWLTVIPVLVMPASAEMVFRALTLMSALVVTIVTPTLNVKTLLAPINVSATQVSLEMANPAAILMSAAIQMHAPIMPLVQIPRVITHVPVMPGMSQMAWFEERPVNVKILMNVKMETTTVMKTQNVKTLMEVSPVPVTKTTKEMELLVTKLTNAKLELTTATQTQHASQL